MLVLTLSFATKDEVRRPMPGWKSRLGDSPAAEAENMCLGREAQNRGKVGKVCTVCGSFTRV
jgi:hypothetical protein